MSFPATTAFHTAYKLRRAREAVARVAQLSTVEKNSILSAMAEQIERNQDRILTANQMDLAAAALPTSTRDRLLLNPQRIAEMAEAIRSVVRLDDPAH